MKKVPVACRVEDQIKDKLEQEAKKEKVKLSKYVAAILTDHVLNPPSPEEKPPQPEGKLIIQTQFREDSFYDVFVKPYVDAFLDYGEESAITKRLLSNPEEWNQLER